jgi:SNF2 family DNA or RNA helicase
VATTSIPKTGAASPSSLPPIGDHQDRAINRMMEEQALLIEYGTGTGKSRIYVEAIEALLLAGEVPILVLVPNSLIEQTVQEFWTWLGKPWVRKHLLPLTGSMRIDDRRHHLRYGNYPVYLLSHEAMSYPAIREGLTGRRWAAVFLDEASRFRNYSNRTRTLIGLGKRAASRYAFTGNLAPRVSSDVWYVMNWLKPGLFGTTNRQIFTTSYCLLGGWEGREVVAIRPDKLNEFRSIMDANRISCDLSDIRDLPERVLHVHHVNMPHDTRKAYATMQETLRLEIERVDDETFKSHVRTYATRLQRLQEITSGFARNIDGEVVSLPSAKTGAMIDLLEDEPDTPTVIWYWWTPELDGITQALGKKHISYAVYKTGNDAVAAFMNGAINVIVMQLASGGYGFNLTRATRMIYHSLPWSLDIYLQSQERNMRLTTTADHLEIVHLTTRQSVDEYVRSRLLERADISAQLTRSQALELLRS